MNEKLYAQMISEERRQELMNESQLQTRLWSATAEQIDYLLSQEGMKTDSVQRQAALARMQARLESLIVDMAELLK